MLIYFFETRNYRKKEGKILIFFRKKVENTTTWKGSKNITWYIIYIHSRNCRSEFSSLNIRSRKFSKSTLTQTKLRCKTCESILPVPPVISLIVEDHYCRVTNLITNTFQGFLRLRFQNCTRPIRIYPALFESLMFNVVYVVRTYTHAHKHKQPSQTS